MKRAVLFFLLCLLCIPGKNVNATDYTLKNGKTVTGTYAGEEEDSYNYYKICPSKNGFIAINVTTSDKKELAFDICNDNKEVVASDVIIGNKQTVFHKVSKGKNYLLRVKGNPNVTYKISYRLKNIDTLTYAKKYTYTFTNASFNKKENSIRLKIKTTDAGILQFMSNIDNDVNCTFLDSKKKAISKKFILKNNGFAGIGAKKNKIYYIDIWNAKESISGTTTLKNIKYQIKSLFESKGTTYNLLYNKKKESLVAAGEKSTYWFKINMPKKQKLRISVQSKMMQNCGSFLQLDLYNVNKIKMTSQPVVIKGVTKAKYNKKKYVLHYPKVTNITTGELPKGTYYVKVTSKTKLSSGSFVIYWK